MKKRVLTLLMALIFIIALSAPAYAANAATEARKSIAVVAQFLELDDGSIEGFTQGTGFFIGKSGEKPQYLLTNHHVVEDYLEVGAGEWCEYKDDTGSVLVRLHVRVYFDSEDYVEAYVVAYDEAQDVAVLRLDSPTAKRQPMKLCVPTDDMVGDTLYSIGYPGIADINTASKWSENDAVITQGSIGRLVTTPGTGTKWIQSSDTDITNGNSGGPMVNANGSVVGIAEGSRIDDSSNYGVGYAVNIEPVIALLGRNNIPYELEKSGLPIIPIAAAAAVVVAVIAVIVAVKAKKNKKKTAVSNNAVAEAPRAKVPAVRSMAAQHNGLVVRMANGRVTIGRQPSNDIVFKKDTRGVSGNHCSVSWDAARNEFVVVDLGSTYGTFLATGQKLNPNVEYRLRSGDNFYLGDSSNMLHLEVE